MVQIAKTTKNNATDKAIQSMTEKLIQCEQEIGKLIYGQETVIRFALTSILSGGHLILIGVPGLAKTKLVQTLGTVLGLDNKRIQCTPDLMPADILGSEILEDDKSFRFVQGPIFTQLLMADEINRASPRTQSALLEAMQEKQVTIAGQSHALPTPFHVLATQNPIEQEGTYPLPEAQLDRFLMQVPLSYPDEKAEQRILIETTGNQDITPKNILKGKDLTNAQSMVRELPVGETLVEQITKLVRLCRPETSNHPLVTDYVEWGPSPRAGQAFMLAARAYAMLDGRNAPLLQDVIDVAKPILRHRIGLSFKARADNITTDHIIETLCQEI